MEDTTPAFEMDLLTPVGIMKWVAWKNEHYLRLYGRGEMTYEQYVDRCKRVGELADTRLMRLDVTARPVAR